MTTQRLRDLLEERVADVEAGDLAARAWARADRVRRRRRLAAIGTAAAAVLVVAGGVAVLDDSPPRTSSPTGRPTATPSTPPATEVPRAEHAGEFRGASFWWAPSGELDGELPVLQVPGLPEEISFADAPYLGTPPEQVDAVFGTGNGQYLLFSNETMVSVDLVRPAGTGGRR